MMFDERVICCYDQYLNLMNTVSVLYEDLQFMLCPNS